MFARKKIVIIYMDDYLYGFNNVCVFSSLIFITNIIISWYYNNYIYVFLFSCLLVTSILCHYTQENIMYYIDKFFIFFIIIYGGYLVFNKSLCDCNANKYFCIFIIVITFLACVYLYESGISNIPYEIFGVYGKYNHVLLHLLSSFGHNLIVML